jgi:hypothetical protein
MSSETYYYWACTNMVIVPPELSRQCGEERRRVSVCGYLLCQASILTSL